MDGHTASLANGPRMQEAKGSHWVPMSADRASSRNQARPAPLNQLQKEMAMLTVDELESMIDAAQTTDDNKAVEYLAEEARKMLRQIHGVESVLLAVGKRPPLADTENAVRYAVGMPWSTTAT